MRLDLQVVAGLVCIAAGAAGLIAMNLFTVPAIVRAESKQAAWTVPPKPSLVAGETKVLPGAVPDGLGEAADPVASNEGASNEGAPNEGEHAQDAAVDGAEEGAAGGTAAGATSGEVPVAVTSTTTVVDGTVLPSIRFEPQKRSLAQESVKDVIAPIAEYMRNNFGTKATLVGHGDDGMSAAEYGEMGRWRALNVLRLLSNYGVSESRVGIVPPAVDRDRAANRAIPTGAVEVRIEPRFQVPKKGGDNAP